MLRFSAIAPLLFAACSGAYAMDGAAPSLNARSSASAAYESARRLAADTLERSLRSQCNEVQLESVSDEALAAIPSGDLMARVSSVGVGRIPTRARVDIDVWFHGRVVQSIPFWFRVRAYADRWVMLAPGAPGHVLGAADVELRRVQVAGLPPAVVAEPIGMRLRAALPADAVLSAAMLEQMPAVVRGDSVALEVREGDVVVEVRATAVSDADERGELRVRVPGAGTLRGQVVDRLRVEVTKGATR